MPHFDANGNEEWVCQLGGHVCTGLSVWIEGRGNACVECIARELPAPLQGYQSLLTHNGKFTVKSLRTGDHRTFQVRTQPNDAKFAPGRRVLSLLTGSDNENNYTGFAFVDDHGIHVYSKYGEGSVYRKYAEMLEKLQEHITEGRIEVMASTTCRVCNRTLTEPESVKSGIGPVCAGRK